MEELFPLVLGIRIPQNTFRRVVLPLINFDWKIEEIKAEAIKQTGLTSEQVLLIHQGVVLNEENTLKSYGIKPGVTIHVLRKRESHSPIVPKTMSGKEMHQLALAFRTFALNPGYRSTLAKLSQPETLENIEMAIPGLRQDPIACSIIRDPELLVHMGDSATVKRVVEKHPVLAEAANYIAAAVHEETAAARHARRAGEIGSSSALDAFSGEEMDSSQSSDSPPARSSAAGGITSSQLEAALAAVTASALAGPSTSSSSNRSTAQDRTSLITSEMFNSALQQAFQGIAVPNFSSSPVPPRGAPTVGTAESPFTMADRMSQQLQQMREMGLRDQVFNLQALQITNGDVQAAIELVMSSGNNGRDEDEEDENAFRQ